MAIMVLVVDDEEQVRGLIKEILEQMQPDVMVIEAQNGAKAQAAFNTPGTSIEAVITDFDLGNGMTGSELIAWLRQNHPEIPILLFTSHELPGYADEFLLKPASIASSRIAFGRLMARIKKPVA